MEFNFNIYSTFLVMVIVLLVGRFFIKKFDILRKFDIPEPVVGGIIAAVIILVLAIGLDFKIQFNESLKDPLMLGFFTSIGLNADLKMLGKAGKSLIVFLLTTIGLLILQNIVGTGAVMLMGENPLIGLIGGSISLTGGFGTGAAWGTVFENAPYNFEAATTVSVVCATFGLVAAGLMGGPMANFYIKRYNLKIPPKEETGYVETATPFETPLSKVRLITLDSFIESLALLIISIYAGSSVAGWMEGSAFTLPTFVWCLFFGILIRNTLAATKLFYVFDREVDVIGNVCLSLFLAFSLMNINLLALVNLAFPILVVLACQVILMLLYGWLVTFKLCGKNYDAAVLTAGQCGFAIGSTYNAIANMQSITQHHGPSPSAFIIVPMVGAFFIDIINAVIINIFIQIPIY